VISLRILTLAIIDLIIIAGDLPATTSLPVMARYMFTHPMKALSKRCYTNWVYKGEGRNYFVQKQINSATAVLKILARLKVPIVYITGNVDSNEVLKVIINWKKPKIYFLNSNQATIDFLTIWGTGGALVYDQSRIPICDHEFTEKEFHKRFLPILNESTRKFDILVTHEPPAFELAGENQELKGGSLFISEIIKKKKPRLVIFGHYHELAIFKQTANITYLNPGPLACYYYALIEITKENLQVSLNKLQPVKLDSTKIIYQRRSPISSLHRSLRFV